MQAKQIAQKMFTDIVKEYENEKMIKQGGFVKKTTPKKILSKIEE